jgi:uncharacterized protein YgbK (DUF1537 family)
MQLLIGAIADDMTGATDLALMLGKQGMSAVQYIGLPEADTIVNDAQAAVVALKSRTIPVDQAVSESLSACDWLLDQGVQQIFFKYCSTFDSTDKGNIGPVAKALMNRLESQITIFCPAFPQNGRTVYMGHLFVGEVLLSDSSMRHHPLTPMRDSNLVSLLGKQVEAPQEVGLIPYSCVEQGAPAIRKCLYRLIDEHCRYAVVDALTDRHLMMIGEACKDLKLITGGSGVALGLPANYNSLGILDTSGGLARLAKIEGGTVVLSGSCSAATRRQVSRMADHHPARFIDPLALADGSLHIKELVEWAASSLKQESVLIYSTTEPNQVATVQSKLGRDQAGHLVEQAFARLAEGLCQSGVKKWIVAGGETSGAVLKALGVKALRIGPEIAPGVPWTTSDEDLSICLALKSGNFGDDDFFQKALEVLP